MREILFKAKRIDNGEWVQGCLLIDYVSGQYFIHANGNSVNESDKVGEEGCLKFFAFEVDPSTICQYTGLTDKNGKKIWENDVVKCIDKNSVSKFIAVVEFGNPNSFYSWGYQLKHIKGDKPNMDILLWIDMEETGATCEVIGNIFETQNC